MTAETEMTRILDEAARGIRAALLKACLEIAGLRAVKPAPLTDEELRELRRVATTWSGEATSAPTLRLLDEHAALKVELKERETHEGRLERNAEACAYRRAAGIVRERLGNHSRVDDIASKILAEVAQ